ncbi:hypothetical protein D3C78_1501430 [compost metagenome]
MDAGCGHVIHMEELPHRCTGAPHHDLVRTLQLGLVETAHQGGNNVGVFRMKVVVIAVQVGWHHTAIVTSILPVVGLT